MAELAPNLSAVAVVTAYFYGTEQEDSEGNTFRPVLGIRPGARLDVQAECIEAVPALAAFLVEPAEPVHDCGPNGVRLYAATFEELQTAAPPTGGRWDIWIPIEEGEHG